MRAIARAIIVMVVAVFVLPATVLAQEPVDSLTPVDHFRFGTWAAPHIWTYAQFLYNPEQLDPFSTYQAVLEELRFNHAEDFIYHYAWPHDRESPMDGVATAETAYGKMPYYHVIERCGWRDSSGVPYWKAHPDYSEGRPAARTWSNARYSIFEAENTITHPTTAMSEVGERMLVITPLESNWGFRDTDWNPIRNPETVTYVVLEIGDTLRGPVWLTEETNTGVDRSGYQQNPYLGRQRLGNEGDTLFFTARLWVRSNGGPGILDVNIQFREWGVNYCSNQTLVHIGSLSVPEGYEDEWFPVEFVYPPEGYWSNNTPPCGWMVWWTRFDISNIGQTAIEFDKLEVFDSCQVAVDYGNPPNTGLSFGTFLVNPEPGNPPTRTQYSEWTGRWWEVFTGPQSHFWLANADPLPDVLSLFLVDEPLSIDYFSPTRLAAEALNLAPIRPVSVGRAFSKLLKWGLYDHAHLGGDAKHFYDDMEHAMLLEYFLRGPANSPVFVEFYPFHYDVQYTGAFRSYVPDSYCHTLGYDDNMYQLQNTWDIYGDFLYLSRTLADSLIPARELWFHVQADSEDNWGNNYGVQDPIGPFRETDLRQPTPEEFRCMTLLTMAHLPDCIAYWTLFYVPKKVDQGDKTAGLLNQIEWPTGEWRTELWQALADNPETIELDGLAWLVDQLEEFLYSHESWQGLEWKTSYCFDTDDLGQGPPYDDSETRERPTYIDTIICSFVDGPWGADTVQDVGYIHVAEYKANVNNDDWFMLINRSTSWMWGDPQGMFYDHGPGKPQLCSVFVSLPSAYKVRWFATDTLDLQTWQLQVVSVNPPQYVFVDTLDPGDGRLYHLWESVGQAPHDGSGYSFDLGVATPNPFNPETVFRFSLPNRCLVSLEVYNVLGQRVATLASGEYAPGHHEVRWNAEAHASGVYFARLQAGDSYSTTQKLILLK
jgi:hypothetical protein